MIQNFWSPCDNCLGGRDERARSQAELGPGGNGSEHMEAASVDQYLEKLAPERRRDKN